VAAEWQLSARLCICCLALVVRWQKAVSWVDGLGEHLFILGNLSTRRGLIGAEGVWADSDILDLGRDSAFFGTPAAQLHAAMWMMARSPLMYGGELPITDATTLNLVTNKLALMINSHSSPDLRVAYRGNCSCVPKSGFACHPRNSAGTLSCHSAATQLPLSCHSAATRLPLN
jgi:hypothetical protein